MVTPVSAMLDISLSSDACDSKAAEHGRQAEGTGLKYRRLRPVLESTASSGFQGRPTAAIALAQWESST